MPLDPDSQYGSGSTKSLNPDPIRIRIHNPVKYTVQINRYFFKTDLHEYQVSALLERLEFGYDLREKLRQPKREI
jgi:hypothetical protein